MGKKYSCYQIQATFSVNVLRGRFFSIFADALSEQTHLQTYFDAKISQLICKKGCIRDIRNSFTFKLLHQKLYSKATLKLKATSNLVKSEVREKT